MQCGYFDTTRNGNHSAFLTSTVVGGRRSLLSWNLESKWSTPFEKRRLLQISADNVSTVRDSEKVQLRRIGSWPRAFQRSIGGVRTLLPSPPKGAICVVKGSKVWYTNSEHCGMRRTLRVRLFYMAKFLAHDSTLSCNISPQFGKFADTLWELTNRI